MKKEPNGVLEDEIQKLAQTAEVPYTLVIGDNEVANNLVTYRKHGTQAQVTVSVEEFVNLILEHNKNHN